MRIRSSTVRWSCCREVLSDAAGQHRPISDAGSRPLDCKLQSQYDGQVRDEASQALASTLANLSGEQRMTLAVSAVDTLLGTLLASLEEAASPAFITDGVDVKDVSDGLAGELSGARGWISRYSRFPESV